MDKTPTEIESILMNFDFDNIVASLGELGIQVKNPDGTFRNFSDVMKELSVVWDKLNLGKGK